MKQPTGSRKRGATDHSQGVAKKSKSRQAPEQTNRVTRRSKEPLAESSEPERLLRQRRREQQQKGSPKGARHSRWSREQQDKAKEQPTGCHEPAQDPAANMADRRQRSAGGSGGAGGHPTQQQGLGRQASGDDDRSTLHNLLRRLGAGFDDIFPAAAMGGSGGGRVRTILNQLREEDEMVQLGGLTELCEYLSISTEDTLAAFPTEQVVPLLVAFLGYEHNPEQMLLAARALTFLADVFPPSSSSIIRHGAVPAFCSRLLTIEYIDLAEQSLQALEKLSHDHPGRLLDAGALVAVLSYVDFFQTGVQRVAVATAANMCRGLGTQHADAATTAAPILINMLQYQDAKIVDSACLALTRIAEAFARSPPHLESLCGLGLVASIVQMVGVSDNGGMTSQLQVSTFYGLLKILATMARGSHVVAEALLQASISQTLRNLLATSSLLSTSTVSPGNVLRSVEQLGDLVGLAAALLPPIPDAAAAMLQDIPPSPSFAAAEDKEPGSPAAVADQADKGGSSGWRRGSTGGERRPDACRRTAFLRDNSELLQKLTADLLPLMIKVYYSSVTPGVKRQCLTCMAKMLHFNTPHTLGALLQDIPAAGLVAALLGARDSTITAFGMQMAEILMEKLPDIYNQHFLKEGVVHAIEQLAATPPAEEVAAASPRGESGRRASGSGRPASRAADKDAGEAVSPGADAKTPAGDTLRCAVGTRARRFHARYFTDDKGHTVGCETEGVHLLRDICTRLPDPAAVPALLEALASTGSGSVSTFELLSSGTVKALRAYLQGDDLADGPCRQQQLLQRLGDFSAAAVPPGSGSEPPLGLLVSKLLGALAASEKFVVQLNPITPPTTAHSLYGGAYYRTTAARSTGGASSGLAAGLSALSNPLKIRLTRASDEPGLRDYSANMVLIEPLASMSQIEDFLWPRVGLGGAAPGNAATGAAGDDPRSRQGARSAAAHGWSGAAEPSVGNAAARVNAASAAAEAAAAAARAAEQAVGSSRSRSRGRQASKEQPIPQRRMTRAQARQAAEAEVAAQGAVGEEEEAREHQQETEGAGGSRRQPNTTLQAAEAAAAAAEAALAAVMAVEGEVASMEEEEMLVGGAREGHHHGEQDFEDDDEDMEEGGYVEGEDEEYDEEEDEEGDMAAHVHDMHLGPADDSADPAAAPAGAAAPGLSSLTGPEAAGSRQGARTAPQTYAQATGRLHGEGTSGPGSSRGQGSASQPQRHLAFYMVGRLLQPGTTVFQAVQQQLADAAAAGASGASASVAAASSSGSDLGQRLWGEVHTITYRSWGAAVQLQENEAAASVVSPRAMAAAAGGGSGRHRGMDAMDVDSGPADHDDASRSPLAELLESALPADIVASQDTLDVLAVLRVAEAVNRLAPHLMAWLEGRQGRLAWREAPPPGHLLRDAFLSSKLAPKLGQQLKDVLSICGGALPPWCRQLVHAARFLFPFEARRRFFYCTSFGLARALHYLQQLHAAEHGPVGAVDREAAGNLRIGRVQRQKVRISRRRLLDSAFKVFELYAGSKSQLEIEFFNEVGTGLGPTLEFYTLLSHELQRQSLGIWRHDSSAVAATAEKAAAGSRKMTNAAGATEDTKRASVAVVASLDAAPGAALARSISGPGPLAGELDQEGGQLSEAVRAGDLVTAPQGLFPAPLPPAERGDDSKVLSYFRLLGRAVAKALQDGRLLDLPLSPLLYRLALGRRVDLFNIKAIDPQLGASLERLHAAYHAHSLRGGSGPLLVDGCPLEDLCLTFELPGRPGYPLHPHGAQVPVTASNLRQYLDAVVEATLGAGVSAQVDAFRTGFNAIFPIDSLAAFYEDEIEVMLCGMGEAWTTGYLSEVLKFDHGYTAQSGAVRFLLEVLAELDPVEQRRFLRFVTGTPRLPPGGLAALQPRLTVVRKLSHAASGRLGATEGTSAPLGAAGQLSGSSLGANSAPGGVSAGIRQLDPADGDLPSVMTCANYIKLPPYSSKEVLRDRLLFAIREGQNSFDLS